MNITPTDHHITAPTWAFPARKQKLPDGRWVIMPGEPQARCRTDQACKITGLSSKVLHRLADAGIIRRAKITHNIVLWWPAEIEAVIERASLNEGYAAKLQHAATLSKKDLLPGSN